VLGPGLLVAPTKTGVSEKQGSGGGKKISDPCVAGSSSKGSGGTQSGKLK